MVIVPRASTHLDFAVLPPLLPASRYGQDLSSAYIQAWLAKYLNHDASADAVLLGRQLSYLEPAGRGSRTLLTIPRDPFLSFYFCSGYAMHGVPTNTDLVGAGC
jgi:hypothetical protein